MQLFSRKKALAALSLGALAALGACGDDVTVPVAPAAPVVISITPPSASMNVGESVSFAVQISGGSTTPTLASCTSSNPAVASAAVAGSACRVTAVAAGNATVTAAASTGQVAAASVTVAAPAPAITSLSVSPSAAQLGVGQTVTLVPTVQPAGRTVAYTYATSSAAIATVANGVVTAVAPGVATITVTAAGSGTGFTNATIAQAVTITVSERTPGLSSLQVSPQSATLAIGATQQLTAAVQGPRASAATITYGSSAPSIATASATGVITAVAAGTATITVTAQSTQDGAFAASSITGLVSVTVLPNAQVVISSLTKNGSTVDIADVKGQFEVNLSVNPNGQTVQSVQAWVCAPAETVAACAARTSGVPAAQQSFTASGAQASNVQLYINSAEFTAPNFTTGDDANTLYKNGLRTIVATVTTTPAAASTIASNNISQVNFNNTDGFTISWTLPTRRANDASGNTWYGGPAAEGTGSFTVVPVLYTPGRTIGQVTLNPAVSGACGGDIIDNTRPFRATYGVQTYDSATVAFNCTGVATTLNGHAPAVIASLDNNNAAGPTATGGAAAPATSIFAPITFTATAGGKYYQSLAYQASSIFVPADWQAPVITKLDVRGGGAASVDSGWVNGTYAFNQVVNASTGETRYTIGDAAGVGLFPTAQRNTVFSVCATPATIPADAAVSCATPVASGGLTATVAGINLNENTSNLTNQAYFLVASETDRLSNRTTSNPFTYTDANGNTVLQTDSRDVFGVDRTNPVVQTIPNASATVDPQNPAITGVRSGIDSIFTAGANTFTAGTGEGSSISATNARFAVRVTDERSGFYSCTASVSCTSTSGSEFHLGTFQITRRRIPNSPLATNDATVESIIATPTATSPTLVHVMNGTAPAAGSGLRDFSINIFGAGSRAPSGVNVGSGEEGYYTFTGTLVDRAGNTTAVPTRNVVIDNDAPVLNNVILPATYTGGAATSITVQASDDLEVMGAELRIGFPQVGFGAIYFPRVANFASTSRMGLFQNPFAALTSNKLATPTGLGQFFAGTVNMPIPFVQDLTLAADVSGAVSAPGAGAAQKPNLIGARVVDIKALANPTGGTTPTTFANSMSGWENRSITASTVSGSTLRKNWGATEVVGGVTNTGAQIAEWTVYNSGTTTNAVVEFRARAITSSASVPFSTVYVVMKRFNTTSGLYEDYEYRGPATYAGPLDDGGIRYFRYTVPATSIAASAQGNNVSLAAFTGMDSIRAIGVDASGNALATPAAIPGTTTVPRVISGFGTAQLNVFENGSANYNTNGGWFSRGGTGGSVTTALNLAGDSRLFVGYGAAATARLYFPVTLASGVAATGSGNTTVTCTSSNPTDLIVVASGVAQPLAGSLTGTLFQPFCDVRGANANASTLTVTVARAAEGPYAAATTVNTFTTSPVLYTADPTISALGTVGALGAGVTVGTNREATFSIGAPTFFGSANATNTTMEYRVQLTGTATGVTPSVQLNAITGGATAKITCSAAAVTASQAFTVEILGRGVSLIGYSYPRLSGTTISGNCGTM
jgi:uncharacterized protein YjdB